MIQPPCIGFTFIKIIKKRNTFPILPISTTRSIAQEIKYTCFQIFPLCVLLLFLCITVILIAS